MSNSIDVTEAVTGRANTPALVTELTRHLRRLSATHADVPSASLQSAAEAIRSLREASPSPDLLPFQRLALSLERFLSSHRASGGVPFAEERAILLDAARVLERLSGQLDGDDEPTSRRPPPEKPSPIALLGSLCPEWQGVVADAAVGRDTDIALELDVDDVVLERRVLEALRLPLENLLRNAVTYGIEPPAERRGRGKDARGSLRIRARQCGALVQLFVEDDGRGWPGAFAFADTRHRLGRQQPVPPESLLEGKLFEPGLGRFASVSACAWQELSRISCYVSFFHSTSGGSVRLEFPVGCLHAERMIPDPRSPQRGVRRRAKPRVLLVEDSVAFALLMKNTLSIRGYEVRTARDGLEALGLLERGGFEAVVSDVRMPRMDGLDLVSRIRNSESFASLPVILVTSESPATLQDIAVNVGADGYVTKSAPGYSEQVLQLLRDEIA